MSTESGKPRNSLTEKIFREINNQITKILTLFQSFVSDSVSIDIPKMFSRALLYQPLKNIDISYSPLGMINHELHLTAFAAHGMTRLRLKKSTVETHLLYKGAGLPLPCPTG